MKKHPPHSSSQDNTTQKSTSDDVRPEPLSPLDRQWSTNNISYGAVVPGFGIRSDERHQEEQILQEHHRQHPHHHQQQEHHQSRNSSHASLGIAAAATSTTSTTPSSLHSMWGNSSSSANMIPPNAATEGFLRPSTLSHRSSSTGSPSMNNDANTNTNHASFIKNNNYTHGGTSATTAASTGAFRSTAIPPPSAPATKQASMSNIEVDHGNYHQSASVTLPHFARSKSMNRHIVNQSFMGDESAVSAIIHNAARITNWRSVLALCKSHPHCAKYAGPDGWTALHQACNRRCPYPNVVEALIHAHPDALLEIESEKGMTPLHYACRFKAPKEVVRLLLHLYPTRGKSVVSRRDRKGRTPLYYAVRYDAPDGVVQMLLEVDPSVVLDEDRNADSPLAVVWDAWAEKFEGKKTLQPFLNPTSTTNTNDMLRSSSMGGSASVGGNMSSSSMGAVSAASTISSNLQHQQSYFDLHEKLQRCPKLLKKWNTVNVFLRAAFGFCEDEEDDDEYEEEHGVDWVDSLVAGPGPTSRPTRASSASSFLWNAGNASLTSGMGGGGGYDDEDVFGFGGGISQGGNAMANDILDINSSSNNTGASNDHIETALAMLSQVAVTGQGNAVGGDGVQLDHQHNDNNNDINDKTKKKKSQKIHRQWRVLHATAAIKCHPTLFMLSRALYPEQASEIDENDLRPPPPPSRSSAGGTSSTNGGTMASNAETNNNHDGAQEEEHHVTSTHQTALHLAVSSATSGEGGRAIMKALAELCPFAAQVADGIDGSLPLHLIVENERKVHWINDGVRDVYEMNPSAVHTADNLGRLPLHRAAARSRHYTKSTPLEVGSVIINLLQTYRRAASTPDASGRYALHYVAEHGEVWDEEAQAILDACPAATQHRAGPGLFNRLPIHMAAASPDARRSLIEQLVELHPRGVTQTDQVGKLPLHLACESGKAWDKGVSAIHEAFPNAIRSAEGNSRNWMALHMASASPNAGVELIRNLCEIYPRAACELDSEQKYPLHLACASGKTWQGGLQHIFDANPDAIHHEDSSGMLPFHIVAFRYCATSTGDAVVDPSNSNSNDVGCEIEGGMSSNASLAVASAQSSGTESEAATTEENATATPGSAMHLLKLTRSTSSSRRSMNLNQEKVNSVDHDAPKVEIMFELLRQSPDILRLD